MKDAQLIKSVIKFFMNAVIIVFINIHLKLEMSQIFIDLSDICLV